MSKKILFISSENTGSGHKSITEALTKQLLRLDPDLQITVVDGFTLGNGFLRLCARVYDPLAVRLPAVWGLIYYFGDPFKPLINVIVSSLTQKSFRRKLNEVQPDLIVSVHALFVGSVLHIMKKANMDIPVVSLIADLDNIASLWADRRAKWIVCPTPEAKQKMIRAGIKESALFETGFPVRTEFSDALPAVSKKSGPKSILIISGSQGSDRVGKIVRHLIGLTDIRITVIAGHNSRLKARIETLSAQSAGNQVTVYGFVREMKERMSEADMIIARASPNVVMEAVNLCKPVIVVGALRGQEARNPDFIERHGLGVYCRRIADLPAVVTKLLENDGEGLRRIRDNQDRFRKPGAARDISRLLIDTVSESPDSVGLREACVADQS